MKNRRNLICGWLTGVVVCAAFSSSFAQPKPGMPHGRRFPSPAGPIESIAEELGIDEATMKKIRTKAEEKERKVIEIDSQLREDFRKLRLMMDEDNPDEQKIMAQVDKIGSLHTSLRKEQIKLMLYVHKLMTPEQRTKLRRIMMNRPSEKPPVKKEINP
jgi:Spy/CpxP family protein refolding chaperone